MSVVKRQNDHIRILLMVYFQYYLFSCTGSGEILRSHLLIKSAGVVPRDVTCFSTLLLCFLMECSGTMIKALLLRHIAQHVTTGQEARVAQHFSQKADEVEAHAQLVRQVVLNHERQAA